MCEPVTRYHRVVAAVERFGVSQVALSRATSCHVHKALDSSYVIEEIPTIGGRTVWEAATHRRIVEQPNDWGVITPDDDLQDAARVVDHRDEPRFLDRTTIARRTAKRLNSIRGVGPLRIVEAPWFVVLFPVDPIGLISTLPTEVAHHLVALERFPEVPGGVRFEIGTSHDDTWSLRCVASIAEALSRQTAEENP